MAEKTTVTVKRPNGVEISLHGDTVIVFTVKDVEGYLENKVKMAGADVGYIGEDIPHSVFADVLGALVSSFIKKRYEDSEILTGYNLHAVSEILLEESDKVTKKMVNSHTEEEIAEMNGELARVILFGD